MGKPKDPPEPITLLIDGDVISFIAAAACQNTLEDEHGFIMPFVRMREAEVVMDNMVQNLKVELKATEAFVVLSDPEDNWRWQVDETYKGNRDPASKPLALKSLKERLREKFGAFSWPGLEADDTLGILATTPQEHVFPKWGKVIVVGRDKDFKSIPGFHHQLGDTEGGKLMVREISQWEADRFHLIQTLAGDRVDGYAGCPGLGMDRAAAIVDKPVRLVPQEGVKTRGIHKGESVQRWFAEPTNDYWACIVSHYRKAGLTEADALVTARLARILRYGEYDREAEAVTLWTPEKLREVTRV